MRDLFAALEAHDLDALSATLAAGADPEQRKTEPPHWRPLHEAIEQLEHGGSPEALALLLRHDARVDAGAPETPLLMALQRGRSDAALLLLAGGADPNVRGPEGDSPMRLCAQRGDVDTAQTLLRCGAALTIDDAGGPSGASALGIAAARLDVPMIALLLRWGAKPEAWDADRMTAVERLPPRTSENAVRHELAQRLLGRGQ